MIRTSTLPALHLGEQKAAFLLTEKRGKKIAFSERRSTPIPGRDWVYTPDAFLSEWKPFIREHFSEVLSARKLSLVLPHELFTFLTLPLSQKEAKKRIGKAEAREKLLRANLAKKIIEDYGFEFEQVERNGKHFLAFRFLEKKVYEAYEELLSGFHAKVIDHQSDAMLVLRLLMRFYPEQKNGNFLFIGEQYASLIHTRGGLFLSERRFPSPLAGEGEELYRIFATQVSQFTHPGETLAFSSRVELPRKLLSELRIRTNGKLLPFCVFDFLKEYGVDVLSYHREEDRAFAPLFALAISRYA